MKETPYILPSLRGTPTMQRFIGAVAARIQMRQKALWSRFIGAGFIAEDIETCWPEANLEYFGITYAGNHHAMRLADLNLRELEELQEWLLLNFGKQEELDSALPKDGQ